MLFIELEPPMLKVIYILCKQNVPIYFSTNRKDLIDYTLEQAIEATIIELPLVPSLQELAEEKANNKLWVKLIKEIQL